MTEPTIYNALQNNFTQVSNEALISARLSGKAYKLYAYMCYRISLNASWIFNMSEILKHFTEGENSMRGAFSELINAGFLERIRVRNNKGIFIKTDFKIYSTPINKGSSPHAENPHVDNPQVGKPRVENQRLNNKDKINKELNNKDFISLEKIKKIFSDGKLKSDPEEFRDHWESVGWMRGKNKITNIEAEIRRWERKHEKMFPEKHKITLNSANSESTIALDKPIKINNDDPLWLKLSSLLKSDFDKDIYDKKLSKLSFVDVKDGNITLAAPSKFLRDWIKREHLESLKSSFQQAEESLKSINIILHEHKI